MSESRSWNRVSGSSRTRWNDHRLPGGYCQSASEAGRSGNRVTGGDGSVRLLGVSWLANAGAVGQEVQ